MSSLKILFVGNSFAVDTMEHAASVALSMGISHVKFGTLYVGGCSLDMHYQHASENLAVYTYYQNEGDGWQETPDQTIDDAVKSDTWDWIAIQHGTKGTARYTSPECYEKLEPLIDHIKAIAKGNPRFAFNMTWMGEHTRQHHEILSYKGDIAAMRKALIETLKLTVLTCPKVDLLVPTGTAIENARTSAIGLLTRDCYHLSVDKGRFIAALTFISCITGLAPSSVTWVPEGVDEYARRVAIESAENALAAPLEITRSKL
jgi:hypothetical protein